MRERIGGYVELVSEADTTDQLVVPPALGDRAGVLGAIRLAMAA